MRGRAFRLFHDFRSRPQVKASSFLLARLILLARVIPEQITPDLDDEHIEDRLADAIGKIDAMRLRSVHPKAT